MIRFARRLVAFFTGALIVILTACAPLPAQTPTSEGSNTPTETPRIPITGNDLVNTQWVLVSFNEGGTETPILPETNTTLEFRENGQAAGLGGCNTFSSNYQAGNGTISFVSVISTKMACIAEGVTEQEQKFFNALQSADRYEVAGNMLRIWYANGQNSLSFSRPTTSTPVLPAPSPTTVAPTIVNPTATSGNANIPERIAFVPGSTSTSLTGNLAAAKPHQYVLRALAGQTLSINLTFMEGQAILVVWGEDGDILLSDHAQASSFQRALPATQAYYIQVKGRPDGNTTYRMTISIPAIDTGVKRIEFPSGAASTTVTGQLSGAGSAQYILGAQVGQTMYIVLTCTEGSAILVVWGADGNVLLSDHAEASSFQRVLPTTQDYYIMVKGRPDGNTSYSMKISIPPPP